MQASAVFSCRHKKPGRSAGKPPRYVFSGVAGAEAPAHGAVGQTVVGGDPSQQPTPRLRMFSCSHPYRRQTLANQGCFSRGSPAGR